MSIQGRAVQRAALPAVFVVATAWWAAFTLYEAFLLPSWFISNIGVFVGHAWQTILMVVYGSVAGAGFAIFLARVRRSDKESALAGESFRNLTTTMGAVPIVVGEPPRALSVPDMSQHGEAGEKVGAWLKAMRSISPAHAALVEALFRIFNHDPMLPATHVAGGHGGKTLIQHSILVTQVMLEMAPSWTYEGLKNKKGDISVALRNPMYKFNPNDPILGIVALAHDLGKMECYIKDGSGKVVDSRHAHDIVSSQMIARLPEFWDIPKEDRDAITLSIAHYHHPQDLPMHADGRARDDRTIAVMELLIKADKAAGKVESGTTYENTMGEEAEADGTPASRLVDDEVLYNAFIEIIHEPGRINGKDSSTRVGQKHQGLLYMPESSLRVALIRKLGLSSTPVLGDGRSVLTVQLMELLAERSLLVQEFDGKVYSFKRAMFRVAFFNSRNGKHLADWPAVLIVNPGANMPQISSMKDHLSRVEITRPVWGESSATSQQPPAPTSGSGGGEDSPPDVPDEEDGEEMLFDAPVTAPPQPAAPPVSSFDSDDLIGDLMGDDPLSQDGEADPVSTGVADESDDEPVPEIQEDDVDTPSSEDSASEDSAEAFNRVAKKLGGNKPLKGLDKGHLEKLGGMYRSGAEAALEALEKKASGRPYSRAMLLVEKAKLGEMLQKGGITLYSSPKGDLLALDEVVASRGRFGWDEAVSQSESGEQDVFSVVRAGGCVYLKFQDFQKQQ